MSTSLYLYAGGSRVPLELDADHVAIELAQAKSLGVDEASVPALASGTRMPAGLVLLSRSELPAKTAAKLEKSGALRHVYRRGSALAVPLPEIRIEVDAPKELAAVLAALASSKVASEVLSKDAGQIVVRPKSGTGEDALELASYVYEQARPASSAPRMLQVTPRPGVR